MKKVVAYNLSALVIKEIEDRAKDENRSKSNWLDAFISRAILVNEVSSSAAIKVSKLKAVTRKPNDDEFEFVWNLYSRKGNKKTSRLKFNKLTSTNKELMSKHVTKYILSTPNKQFRKNLETYINQECWNDEIAVKLTKLEAIGDDRSYMKEEFK